ncbi:MAG: FAD-dependent oxidoreductase, partial [Pseudomonadota bacterium]
PKFEFRLSTSVQAILGTDSVEGVRVSMAGGGATEELACSGVFVFVGLEPNSGYVPDTIARDAAGCVITDETYRTSLPGVYAVGAVRAGYSGCLVDAVGEATAVISTIVAASGGPAG